MRQPASLSRKPRPRSNLCVGLGKTSNADRRWSREVWAGSDRISAKSWIYYGHTYILWSKWSSFFFFLPSHTPSASMFTNSHFFLLTISSVGTHLQLSYGVLLAICLFLCSFLTLNTAHFWIFEEAQKTGVYHSRFPRLKHVDTSLSTLIVRKRR